MLDKDILGLALYNTRLKYLDKTFDELETAYGSIENARKAACVDDAEAIITHFKTLGIVTTTGTASAQTGTIK